MTFRFLHQVVAAEKDDKAKAAQTISKAENQFGRGNLFSGLSKTYTPKDEEGQQLPPESVPIQLTVKEVLRDVKSQIATLIDTIATKDQANCDAKADVVVEGTTLLKDVPATHLLFLEKQLAELLALVKKIPTLDTSQVWQYDESADRYITEPVKTIRTQKVPKALIGHPATKDHPAQVQYYQADEPEGTWTTIKFSSALQVKEANEIAERIEKLQRAVKFAREEANRLAVTHVKAGDVIMGYILD